MRHVLHALLRAQLGYRMMFRVRAHSPQSDEYQWLDSRRKQLDQDYAARSVTLMLLGQQAAVLKNLLPSDPYFLPIRGDVASTRVGRRLTRAQERRRQYQNPWVPVRETRWKKLYLNMGALWDSLG